VTLAVLGNHHERSKMTKRIQKLLMAVAALAALSLGGAVFAQAQSSPTAPERTTLPDTDSVQSGDQTGPDTPAKAAAASHAPVHAVLASSSTTAAPVQSGDQTTPDAPGTATEKPGVETPETGAGAEKPGSEAAGNDGPGGHADAPGDSTADHQFEGNE
jgi:hypothetical protein